MHQSPKHFFKIFLIILLIGTVFLNAFVFAQEQSKGMPERTVIPAISGGTIVDSITMKKIHSEVATPYKYGVILKGDNVGDLVDCANVFFYREHWYMMYIAISKETGYQTFLSQSDDLLHWKKLGRILSFSKPNQWDAWQADASVALCDYRWEGSHELEKFNDRYWLSYIGGALQGYETDPLAIGMAWTEDPSQVKEWKRIEQNPVLSPEQTDVRNFESMTLYKSQIIHDEKKSLGYPFIMYYNGKAKNAYERIGMAVSNDMIHWSRYGKEPVITNGEDSQYGISGDPQIVKIGDVWTMFYFGAFWKPKAFDTFACSYDLVNWTKWTGEHLIQPSEPFDQSYAHKPWVIKWKGVVYHFYCAVGSEGRVIALATSKDMKKRDSKN